MGKMDKQIICVNRTDLFKNDAFQGFLPAQGSSFAARMASHKIGRRRGDVEQDASVKQLIGYAIILHPKTGTIYAYQRSVDPSKYSEKRAAGNWSWGVGGHTEAIDEGGDPVINALRRELAEEVGLEAGYELELLGFINDERDELGSVHFGVLYLVKVASQASVVTGDEFAQGGFKSLGQLQALQGEAAIDGWSEIALHPLADYLQGRKLTPRSF